MKRGQRYPLLKEHSLVGLGGGITVGLEDQLDFVRRFGRDDGQPSGFAHRDVLLLREA
jgi:hypothetical protein